MTQANVPTFSMPGPPPGGGSAGGRFTPVDPIRLLRQYKWLLLVTAVVGIALGFGVFKLLVKYAPEWTASATVSIRSEMTQPMSINTDRLVDTRNLEVLKQTQALYINTEQNLRDALKRADVQETRWYQQLGNNPEEAFDQLREMVRVRSVPETQFVQVSASAPDPDSAARLANAVVAEYISRTDRLSKLGRNRIEEMFNRRADTLREDLTVLQSQADSIMNQTEWAVNDQNRAEVTAQFESLIVQRNELLQAMTVAQNSYQQLLEATQQQTFEPTAEDIATAQQDPMIRNIDSRIVGLREQRRVALERFGEGHRSVRDLDFRIAAAQTERETEFQKQLAQLQEVKLDRAENAVNGYQASLANVDQRLADLRQTRQEIGQKMAEYENLQREIERTEEARLRLEEMLTSVEMIRQHPASLQVESATPASPPRMRSFPKAGSVIPGVTFLLVALAAGLAFLKEMLDSRIKGPSCTKLLSGDCELLGVIPEASDDPNQPGSIDLVVTRDPNGLLAESFRQLRGEVINRMQRHRFKTLMVAGCQPRGGTSSILANLAASAAFNDRRTLIIDANHRRPHQHRIFDLPPAPGLADVLNDQAPLDQAVQNTAIQGLDLMGIGQAESHLMERVESEAFTQMLRQLEQRYDLILIDAPPLSVVGDSRVLANRVDAVVLNVRALQEKRGLVSRMINQVNDARAEFLGLVLNGVRSSAGGYYRRNFEAFYEYQNGGTDGAAPARKRAGRTREPVKS